MRTLNRGGNAIDAAMVATFVLCVVEPQSTGIGGDCFALIAPEGVVPPIGYNGTGRAPGALSVGRLDQVINGRIAETSVHSATIPGLVEGVTRLLADFGTLSLADALQPAIDYAEEGFPVHQRVAAEWAGAAQKLRSNQGGRSIYLKDGRAPEPGDVIVSPALAETLRTIAAEGAEAFYAGPIAQQLVGFLKDNGGTHAVEDFAAHRGDYVEPVSLRYGDVDVWQIPPNCQGITALLMLSILDAVDFRSEEPGTVRYHHVLARAAQLAFEERNRWIGDPATSGSRVDMFLDPGQGARLSRLIDTGHANDRVEAPALGDTAYVAVVDEQRNAVSLISSLFENFGNGLVDPGTGVVFHCRGVGFTLEPDHPNALAPGKRPLHTIMPGMMSRAGKVAAVFGVTGGPYQPIGQAMLVSAMVDRGMDIQAAIDAPRSFFRDGTLFLEPRLMRLAGALAEAGHVVAPAEQAVGGAHGVVVDWKAGVLTGGSDGRKDGCAIAE